MHSYDLILTLTGGLGFALFLGYITHRIGLSPIVGYLIAGMVVGPHTPGFVADSSLAEQLAEIGVILLMFGVGLQFHIEHLLAVRKVAIPGAIAQSGIATVLGALLAYALGWTWPAGIIFGIALSVASTVVLIRVLADNNDLHTTAGHVAVGWLVVEDLFTVVALVLLPALFGQNTQETPLWLSMTITAAKVAGLVAFIAIVGTRFLPKLLEHVARTRSRELFTLTVLVTALGVAVGSAVVFGVSMALGAFLAGLVVGRSEFSVRAASEAIPLRDAFAVLFFVSVGMLLDPANLLSQPALAAGALAIVLVAKPAVALLIALLFRYPLRAALVIAVSLAQIGEFSFILATIGRELRILPGEATNVLVAVSMVSILLNPLLYRAIGPIERLIGGRRTPADSGSDSHVPATDSRHRAVVIGYGPTGRAVVKLLRENGVTPTVVDLNIDAVRELQDQGVHAVFGDAAKVEVITEAGAAGASTLIITPTAIEHTAEVIRTARQLNPAIRVLARTDYLRDLEGLKKAGADRAYAGEGEVALAFIADVMENLGATAEQVDREVERARVRLIAQ